MLTAGALFGYRLAVPQSLEIGQSLRWFHGHFLQDPPGKATIIAVNCKDLSFPATPKRLFGDYIIYKQNKTKQPKQGVTVMWVNTIPFLEHKGTGSLQEVNKEPFLLTPLCDRKESRHAVSI